MYPMVLSETLQLKKQADISGSKNNITRNDFIRFLTNGGFPAIFAIRDQGEREERISEWLKLTCERDVLQIKGLKPDPELCMRIFEVLPLLETPDVANISSRVNQSSKRVQTQLNALEQIFALHSMKPHPLSSGKKLYFHIDPSIVSFFNGDFKAQLDCAILTEYLAKISYGKLPKCKLSYYKGARGSRVSLIVESSATDVIAIKWIAREAFDKRDFAILDVCERKLLKQGIKTKKCLAIGSDSTYKVSDVTILPWEYLF
jgi:predicted AAA+ superfamily ATPase